jgi:polyribonucleotide nucleotidyltransferase
MDFKVAGTGRGITGIQLDLKIDGISEEIIRATLDQARDARREILKAMLTTLRAPRGGISQYAPRLLQIRINPEKIGLLIGPGGKTIKGIQESTGAKIDVDDDGTVSISSLDSAAAEAARNKVEALCEEVKVGKVYEGKVTSIKDFGAFIEIVPGRDGLCHISELDDKYVGRVEDVVKMGDKIRVKVIAIDDHDRVKLSRKALLREEKGLPPAEPSAPPPRRREGGDGGPPRGRREGGDEGGGRGRRREGGDEGGGRGRREGRESREGGDEGGHAPRRHESAGAEAEGPPRRHAPPPEMREPEE